MPRTEAQPEERCPDVQALLDRELSALPAKYRIPVVLADLEGKSRQEVARQLGLPEGTVSSRLARARQLLRRRLARHELLLTGAALGAALSPSATSAAVPARLLTSTVQAAVLFATGETAAAGAISAPVAALMEGVLKAMLLSKLKVATVFLLVLTVVGAGAGALTHRALAGKPAPDRRVGGLAGRAEPGRTESASPLVVARLDKGGEKKELGPTIRGQINSIGDGKITVAVSSGDKKQMTVKSFALAPDLKVFLAEGKKGEEGKLADLSEGLGVELRLSVDQKSVEQIVAHGPTIFADIKAVDPAKSTITVSYKSKKGMAERTFQLAGDVAITLPSISKVKIARPPAGTLADLTPGLAVVLHLSVDKKTVRAVSIQWPGLQGLIKEISPGKNSITIGYKGPDGMASKTFVLAKDVQIHFADGNKQEEGKVADLTEDTSVSLTLSLDRKAVIAIFVPTPSLHGQVRTVDASKRSLVLATKGDGGPEEKSFDVAKDARVILADPGKEQEGKLEHLTEGAGVAVALSRDRTRVVGIRIEGPNVNGSVKSVDGGGESITVTVKEEGQLVEKTFPLAKGASITIHDGDKDRAGNLSDLTEGMPISVKLSVFDKKTAVAVRATKS
jgi:hypothetical protein